MVASSRPRGGRVNPCGLGNIVSHSDSYAAEGLNPLSQRIDKLQLARHNACRKEDGAGRTWARKPANGAFYRGRASVMVSARIWLRWLTLVKRTL